ncbi:MAG: PepSY-associated TM helix domain-containing protein [Rubrobacter sp.]
MTDSTAARKPKGRSRKPRREPTRSLVRRPILWVHLWTSLLVGLFVLVITLSETALVFRDQTDRLIFYPEMYRETPGAFTTSIEEAFGIAEREYPDMQVDGIYVPEVMSGVYGVDMFDDQGSHAFATIDPATGEVLGESGDAYTEGFNGFMTKLHFYLFAGDIGLTDEIGLKVVSIVGIALLVMLVTGVYLWWPGLRRWVSGFRVRWRGDRYARNYDYHKVIGIITVPVLALIALTGVTFGFHETSRSVWYAITFTDPPPEYPASPPKVEANGQERLSLDEFAARVASQTDAEPVYLYYLTAKEDEAVEAGLSAGWDPWAGFNGYDGNVYTYADPYTGEVVWKHDPRELPLAARIFENWLFPLHVGSFGRMPVRILWALVGLAPTVLAVTGLTMWLLKRRANRRRRRTRGAAIS